MAIDVSTEKTLEGNEVVLYSQKQLKQFEAYTKPDTDKRKTKVIRQYPDGGILLHMFFNVDGRWMGYSNCIGKRGGEVVCHAFGVDERENGELFLTGSVSSSQLRGRK